MSNQFIQYDNIFPLLAPVDAASNVQTLPYVDLKHYHSGGFLIKFGNVNSGTATDTEVITVEAATAVDGTEAAIGFSYRTVLVGSNQWGAVATAASTGLSLAVSDDNLNVWIEIDPDEMAANDYRFVRCIITDTPDMAACLVDASWIGSPRYKQVTAVTATASASA